MILKNYRFWCNDESTFVTKWDFDSSNMTCPNDESHSINLTNIAIIDNIPEKIEIKDNVYTEYTYFIDDVNGDDANIGSENYPFKTIQFAISKVPRVSDSWSSVIIKIKPGTYVLDNTLIIDSFKNTKLVIESSTSNPDDVLLIGSEGINTITVSNNVTTINLNNLSVKCQGDNTICIYAIDSLFLKIDNIKFGDDSSSNTIGFFTNCISSYINNCSNIDTNKVSYGVKSTCNKLIIIDDISNFGTTLVYSGTSVINYTVYQDTVNKRHLENHELDTHTDVPTKPTTGNKLLECVQGTFQWSTTPDLNSVGLRGITVNVIHPNQDYEEEESTSWVVLASFVFPGYNILNASLFEIVASRNGDTGLSACRLYDYTNNQQIAYIEWSAEGKDRYIDTNLTNLPQSSSAIFEVQVKRISGSKTRFHASTLR